MSLSRWGIALGISWLIFEPLIVLLARLVPCISPDRDTDAHHSGKIAPTKTASNATPVKVGQSASSLQGYDA